MAIRSDKTQARSGWLVGLIALAGGLAAPVSAPVAGQVAAPARAVATAPPHSSALAKVIAASLAQPGADPELVAFYSARGFVPLWSEHGRLKPEARELVARLKNSRADGLNPIDYEPDVLEGAVVAADSGRTFDLARADLLLSEALGVWASDLHRAKPAATPVYSDAGFRQPYTTRRAVLEGAGAEPTLKEGLAKVARMNPIYAGLRSALFEEQARGGPNVALLKANLERARALPGDLGKRYILVDVAAQRLWMFQDGRPVDSMKVVVGKPSEPTPQMVALVRYAVFRPYWNVPPDLTASGIAPKFMRGGMAYFQAQHLEALSDWSDKAVVIDPQKIDWRAVRSGRRELRIRQQPGPDNMMGRVKFMFPNDRGVYLHDSPLRALFSGEQRTNSAGCVRLEDATRLGRWLLGDAAVAAGEQPGPPETRVDLPEPVPVYLVYLTATPTGEGLSVRKDFYRRDASVVAQLGREARTTQLASASTKLAASP